MGHPKIAFVDWIKDKPMISILVYLAGRTDDTQPDDYISTREHVRAYLDRALGCRDKVWKRIRAIRCG